MPVERLVGVLAGVDVGLQFHVASPSLFSCGLSHPLSLLWAQAAPKIDHAAATSIAPSVPEDAPRFIADVTTPYIATHASHTSGVNASPKPVARVQRSA